MKFSILMIIKMSVCGKFLLVYNINRIYHRSLMQTEKSNPEGNRILSEARFTEIPVLSVDPRVGISWSASETDD